MASNTYHNKYMKERYVSRKIRKDLYHRLVEWCGEKSVNICLEKALNILTNSGTEMK